MPAPPRTPAAPPASAASRLARDRGHDPTGGPAMKCVVTGAAGFIGSHLCERLLQFGHEVVGVDAFIPYYSPALKEANVRDLLTHSRFTLHRLDLRHDDLSAVLHGADHVIH